MRVPRKLVREKRCPREFYCGTACPDIILNYCHNNGLSFGGYFCTCERHERKALCWHDIMELLKWTRASKKGKAERKRNGL